MIIGVVAGSRSIAGGIVESPLYSNALVVMDFENGVYRVNGADTALGDMISRTSDLQAGGLRIDWNAEPYEAAIGLLSPVQAALDLNTGFTVYFDLVQYDAGYYQVLLNFWNGDTATPGRCQLEIQSDETTVGVSSHLYSYDFRRQLAPYASRYIDYTTYAAIEGERRKFAVVSEPSRLAICEAGSAVTENTTDDTVVASYSEFSLFGYAADGYMYYNALVKKIIFYPPKDNASLQALTIL